MLEPVFQTALGQLFAGDCLKILPWIHAECADIVFADPPFNLNKNYGPSTKDYRSPEAYLEWCVHWLSLCERTLKPGGAFYVYNLPKWNVHIAQELLRLGLEFRHWIAVDIPSSMPIKGRLHPSHYSLLYMSKGKPKTFRRIRTPVQLCRHCGGEIKDYGGHRKKLNPKGITLKDVWADIPPVRHARFKAPRRKANALSTKLLDRVVEISSEPGDLVLDPFGGSGTTYAVCEKKKRRWIGVEWDSVDAIIDRLQRDLPHHFNEDVVDV